MGRWFQLRTCARWPARLAGISLGVAWKFSMSPPPVDSLMHWGSILRSFGCWFPPSSRRPCLGPGSHPGDMRLVPQPKYQQTSLPKGNVRRLWGLFTAHWLNSKPLVTHPEPSVTREGPISPNPSLHTAALWPGDLCRSSNKELCWELGTGRVFLPPLPRPAPALLRAPSAINSGMVATSSFRPPSYSPVIILRLNYLLFRVFLLLDGKPLVAVDFVPTCFCVLMACHRCLEYPWCNSESIAQRVNKWISHCQKGLSHVVSQGTFCCNCQKIGL